MSHSTPTTIGLPLFLEDTTGFPQGPTDYYDIYDRPPFIHVRNQINLVSKQIKIDIFELGLTSREQSLSSISLYLEPDLDRNIVRINNRRKRVDQWLYRNGNPR